jgi:hypothetical protein
MGNSAVTAVVAVLTSIVGLALVAVILGSGNTSTVLGTFFTGFAGLLRAATAPVSGSGVSAGTINSITSGAIGAVNSLGSGGLGALGNGYVDTGVFNE